MTSSSFLHSAEWKKFQESNGRRSISLEGGSGFVHTLPIVGSYVYFPRFPWKEISNFKFQISNFFGEEKIGWIRVEPENEAVLSSLQKDFGKDIVKAPHDMQPRENFIIDISKDEEELLSEMKSKTRYNIRLAEKKGVRVFVAQDEKYREDFFRLIDATARRQKILPHPRAYYEKMFEVFGDGTQDKNSSFQLSLFVAEYDGKVIAANLVIFYGDTATYLHGGTSDECREVMAPVLLQWEQIKEAKRRGCLGYDFGGISSSHHSSWEGITRFKMGFSSNTKPVVYPGCFDIILDPKRYRLYDRLRHLQKAFSVLKKFLRK